MRDPNSIQISTAIKLSIPFLRIATIERQFGNSEETVQEIVSAAAKYAKKEAALLSQCLDFRSDDQEWATAFFANHIGELIADNWTEKRTECLSFPYSNYLADFLTADIEAGLPASWKGTSAEVSYTATCVNAMSKALSAYNKFNLFHFDRDKMSNFFSRLILTKSQECVDEVLKVLSESSRNPDSVSSLYQTFIKAAGIQLSDIWCAESVKFIETYKNSTPEEKRQLEKAGGNLKPVIDGFSVSMRETLQASLNGIQFVHRHSMGAEL